MLPDEAKAETLIGRDTSPVWLRWEDGAHWQARKTVTDFSVLLIAQLKAVQSETIAPQSHLGKPVTHRPMCERESAKRVMRVRSVTGQK